MHHKSWKGRGWWEIGFLMGNKLARCAYHSNIKFEKLQVRDMCEIFEQLWAIRESIA